MTDEIEYDLDNEEMYGELPVILDRETGEAYTINPTTGQRNYLAE